MALIHTTPAYTLADVQAFLEVALAAARAESPNANLQAVSLGRGVTLDLITEVLSDRSIVVNARIVPPVGSA